MNIWDEPANLLYALATVTLVISPFLTLLIRWIISLIL